MTDRSDPYSLLSRSEQMTVYRLRHHLQRSGVSISVIDMKSKVNGTGIKGKHLTGIIAYVQKMIYFRTLALCLCAIRHTVYTLKHSGALSVCNTAYCIYFETFWRSVCVQYGILYIL